VPEGLNWKGEFDAWYKKGVEGEKWDKEGRVKGIKRE